MRGICPIRSPVKWSTPVSKTYTRDAVPIGMNPKDGASPKMVWSKEWARDNARPIGMNPKGGASPNMVWSKEWARDNAVPIGMNPKDGASPKMVWSKE